MINLHELHRVVELVRRCHGEVQLDERRSDAVVLLHRCAAKDPDGLGMLLE